MNKDSGNPVKGHKKDGYLTVFFIVLQGVALYWF